MIMIHKRRDYESRFRRIALSMFEWVNLPKTMNARYLEECLYYNPELKNGLFPKIEKILESEPINLFQFESGIIRAKMKDIWNLLTDFNKLTAIAPNNNCLPNVNNYLQIIFFTYIK